MSFRVLPSRAVSPWLQPASAPFSWSPIGLLFPLVSGSAAALAKVLSSLERAQGEGSWRAAGECELLDPRGAAARRTLPRAFSAVLGQARAREWPFSGLPRRARAGRRPETELAAWGGARGAGEGASSSRSPCVPPRTSFRGQRTEVAGGGHCGVLGCLLARDAPLLLFSLTSFPQDELASFL